MKLLLFDYILSYDIGVNSSFYLLMHQSWDTCRLIRFISDFWSKIKKRGGCNKNILVFIFKGNLVASRGVVSIPSYG